MYCNIQEEIKNLEKVVIFSSEIPRIDRHPHKSKNLYIKLTNAMEMLLNTLDTHKKDLKIRCTL